MSSNGPKQSRYQHQYYGQAPPPPVNGVRQPQPQPQPHPQPQPPQQRQPPPPSNAYHPHPPPPQANHHVYAQPPVRQPPPPPQQPKPSQAGGPPPSSHPPPPPPSHQPPPPPVAQQPPQPKPQPQVAPKPLPQARVPNHPPPPPPVPQQPPQQTAAAQAPKPLPAQPQPPAPQQEQPRPPSHKPVPPPPAPQSAPQAPKPQPAPLVQASSSSQAPPQPQPVAAIAADEPVGVRNRVSSPQFQTINLRGSEGVRASPTLRNTLVKSTDTFVEDARNHPHAQFSQVVEAFASKHKNKSLHNLKVTKIPYIEEKELRIKSYSSSQIIETPVSAGADIYTAIAYGVYGDATIGESLRNKMVNTLRNLANWLEAPNRSDLSKVLTGLTADDLEILFRYLMPEDTSSATETTDGAADGSSSRDSGDHEKGKQAVTQQGMVVGEKKKKKKQKIAITRDVVRDSRNARLLRELSNDITHWDDAQGNYIHPLTIIAIASVIFGRTIFLFSVRVGNNVKIQSVDPPRANKQLPVSSS